MQKLCHLSWYWLLCLVSARFKDFVDYYCLAMAPMWCFYLFISFSLCSRVSQVWIYIFWELTLVRILQPNGFGNSDMVPSCRVVSPKPKSPKTWGMVWLPCKVEADKGGSLEDDGEYGEDVVLTSYLVITEARVGKHWLCGAQLYVLMSLPGFCSQGLTTFSDVSDPTDQRSFWYPK